jgi:hypothetical protein
MSVDNAVYIIAEVNVITDILISECHHSIASFERCLVSSQHAVDWWLNWEVLFGKYNERHNVFKTILFI